MWIPCGQQQQQQQQQQRTQQPFNKNNNKLLSNNCYLTSVMDSDDGICAKAAGGATKTAAMVKKRRRRKGATKRQSDDAVGKEKRASALIKGFLTYKRFTSSQCQFQCNQFAVFTSFWISLLFWYHFSWCWQRRGKYTSGNLLAAFFHLINTACHKISMGLTVFFLG